MRGRRKIMSVEEEYKFSGKPIYQTFHNQDYYIYKFEIANKEKEVVSIKGNIGQLERNRTYIVHADQKQVHPKYGASYSVKAIYMDKPHGADETRAFLQEILSDRQAYNLCDAYPDIIDRILQNKNVNLSKIKGVGKKTWGKIEKKIKENFIFFDIVNELDGMFDFKMIKKLFDQYHSKEMIFQKLSEDPYRCLCEISRIGFKRADELLLKAEEYFSSKGKKAPIKFYEEDLRYSEGRCKACIDYLLQKNEDDGSSRMKISSLKKAVIDLIPECADYFQVSIEDDRMFFCYTDKDQEHYITRTRMAYMEAYIAKKIHIYLESRPILSRRWKEIDPEDYKVGDGFMRSKKQLSLLKTLKNNNIIILNGPAGTGKSATITEVIEVAKDLKLSVELMAPTGKAAKVQEEYTGLPASTIHRGLCYTKTGEVGKFERESIDSDLLIIDEMSMTDIYLTYHIMKRLDFRKCKVIIVGDDAQLPSVGTGNMLHDLLKSKDIPKITLDTVYRYDDNGIMKAATDMRKGKEFLPSDLQENDVFTLGDDNNYVFYQTSDDVLLAKTLCLYKALLEQGRDPEDIQVLTAYNSGKFGVDTLNRYFQWYANPWKEDDDVIKCEDWYYHVGDFVMNIKNIYNPCDEDGHILINEMIANGDSGYITRIEKKDFWIDFNGRTYKMNQGALENMKLSYAITYHKSQGSSIQTPIIITPASHQYMLNSNLMYVGASRAKKKLYHIGAAEVVNRCVHKHSNWTRSTNFKYMFNCEEEFLEQLLNKFTLNEKVA